MRFIAVAAHPMVPSRLPASRTSTADEVAATPPSRRNRDKPCPAHARGVRDCYCSCPRRFRSSPMSIALILRITLLAVLVAWSWAAPAQTPAAPSARVIVQFKPDAALLRTKAGSESADRAERAKALEQRVGVA